MCELVINFLFVSLVSAAKTEQQQIPAQVAKIKKRQAVTPAADFPDSDPEDEYDKGCVVMSRFASLFFTSGIAHQWDSSHVLSRTHHNQRTFVLYGANQKHNIRIICCLFQYSVSVVS